MFRDGGVEEDYHCHHRRQRSAPPLASNLTPPGKRKVAGITGGGLRIMCSWTSIGLRLRESPFCAQRDKKKQKTNAANPSSTDCKEEPPPPTLSMRTAESSWHSSSQDLEAEVCKSTQSDLETRERRFDTSNPLFQFGPTSNPIPCQDCERSRKPRRGKTR